MGTSTKAGQSVALTTNSWSPNRSQCEAGPKRGNHLSVKDGAPIEMDHKRKPNSSFQFAIQVIHRGSGFFGLLVGKCCLVLAFVFICNRICISCCWLCFFVSFAISCLFLGSSHCIWKSNYATPVPLHIISVRKDINAMITTVVMDLGSRQNNRKCPSCVKYAHPII